MPKTFQGRWQLHMLNGEPDAGDNVFRLHNGKLIDEDTDGQNGVYEVSEEELVLIIRMSGSDEEDSWILRVRLPLTGALAGQQMLGLAEGLFDDSEPIFVSECSFHRLPANG